MFLKIWFFLLHAVPFIFTLLIVMYGCFDSLHFFFLTSKWKILLPCNYFRAEELLICAVFGIMLQSWSCLSFSDVFLSGQRAAVESVKWMINCVKVTFWKGKLPAGCLCTWPLGWGYVILVQMLLNAIVFWEINDFHHLTLWSIK